MNPRVKRLIDMEKMKQEHDLGTGSNVFKPFIDQTFSGYASLHFRILPVFTVLPILYHSSVVSKTFS